MIKLIPLVGLSLLLISSTAIAQVSEDEIKTLREQIELLSSRLDQLEQQNRDLAQEAQQAREQVAAAPTEAAVEQKVEQAVTEQVEEKFAAVSWAERLRWKGDFRYRYENIDQEGKDGRNRSRIRARTNLEADLSPTLEVGVGLATGGDDPVSSNQTIGGGGSSKDIKLDLAYFNWSGLENTNITGGKFKNYLVRPGGKGLRWDGDWRPEGLGAIWDNDRFYVQGLGTWLEGDSRKGTEFAWALQGGMRFKTGDNGTLSIGVGYSVFDIAGRTPLFGEPEDFYGNSFVPDPANPNPKPGDETYVFKYDYQNYEAHLDWKFKLGGMPFAVFANYTVNQDADENDTGYLVGAKLGSAKEKGDWDVSYYYERLEADSTIGLLADSDFGGGGTDA